MNTHTPVYLQDFSSAEDVMRDFRIDAARLQDADILLAWYGGGSYDGSAFVLLRRGNDLFEVNGGHCSCYGLEDQWDEEATSPDALLKRAQANEGSAYYDSENACWTKLREIALSLGAAGA